MADDHDEWLLPTNEQSLVDVRAESARKDERMKTVKGKSDTIAILNGRSDRLTSRAGGQRNTIDLEVYYKPDRAVVIIANGLVVEVCVSVLFKPSRQKTSRIPNLFSSTICYSAYARL